MMADLIVVPCHGSCSTSLFAIALLCLGFASCAGTSGTFAAGSIAVGLRVSKILRRIPRGSVGGGSNKAASRWMVASGISLRPRNKSASGFGSDFVAINAAPALSHSSSSVIAEPILTFLSPKQSASLELHQVAVRKIRPGLASDDKNGMRETSLNRNHRTLYRWRHGAHRGNSASTLT